MPIKKNKILFVGPFAPPFNGDGVKNSILREGFEKEGYQNFEWFDTKTPKCLFPLMVLKLVWKVIITRQIILSLNIKGRFFIIPFFWVFRRVIKKHGALYVIGGSFDKQLNRLTIFLRYPFLLMLRSLDGIFVESESLKKGIEKFGLKNTIIVYNPRKDSGDTWNLTNKNRNKIVFVSRVTETKGVTVLIESVRAVAAKGHNISLDIFGPVDTAYNSKFQKLIEASSGIVKYKGVIKPEEVQPMLVNYHFKVLPTFHSGEGLPGVLVEAGMAGVPIIITRYNALPEYFEDKISAVFVEPKDVNGLTGAIVELLSNDELAIRVSDEIKLVAKPFRLDFIIKQSVEILESKGWKLTK